MTGPPITLVTAMRNEGPFVLEWIAHHKALGVTAFVIVTNDCDDGTDALLDRLAEAGEVVHLRQEAKPGKVQWGALALAEGTDGGARRGLGHRASTATSSSASARPSPPCPT
jgi:hypothetical protein